MAVSYTHLTDLLRHCFGQPEIKEHYHTFIIDIYATSSVRDFVNVFGKAVLDELRPKGKYVWGTFLNVLASLRSEITFDMNGQPTWGIGLGAITCLLYTSGHSERLAKMKNTL